MEKQWYGVKREGQSPIAFFGEEGEAASYAALCDKQYGGKDHHYRVSPYVVHYAYGRVQVPEEQTCQSSSVVNAYSQGQNQRAQEPFDNNPQTFQQAIDAVLDELRSVMISKQTDYGPENILEFGEKGVLVRFNDKAKRLKNLVWEGNEPNNEAVYDSWLDAANYAIIAMMLRNGTWALPMEGK